MIGNVYRKICVPCHLFKSGFMTLELLCAGRQRKVMDISQRFNGKKNGNREHDHLYTTKS